MIERFHRGGANPPITKQGARRRIALAGFAVLTLSLAACAGGSPEGNAEGNAGSEVELVTLELVGQQGVQEYTDVLVAAYMEANPNVTINASYLPSDAVQTALRTRLGSGNPPDIFTAFPGDGSALSTAQLAQAGLMAPITGQAWLDRVPVGLQELLGYEGETYLWTPGYGAIGTFYNKAVFEENGIEIPQSWGELLSACRQFQDAGVVPIALGAQDGWVTQMITYAIAPSIAFADNPGLATQMLAGETSFSDSGYRDTFERYMELSEEDCFNDNVNGTTFEQTLDLMASGDAAMLVQVNAISPLLEEAAEGRDAEFGMFPFPAADNADELMIPTGIAGGYAVSAQSAHVEIAKDFLEFAGQRELMETYAISFGQIPWQVEDPESLDQYVQVFLPYLDRNMAIPYLDQQWPNAEVQPTHFAVLQQLLAGTASMDEALQQMDDAFNSGS